VNIKTFQYVLSLGTEIMPKLSTVMKLPV